MIETSPYSRTLTSILVDNIEYKNYKLENAVRFSLRDKSENREIMSFYSSNINKMPKLIISARYNQINSNIAQFSTNKSGGEIKVYDLNFPSDKYFELINLVEDYQYRDFLKCKDLFFDVLNSKCSSELIIDRYEFFTKNAPNHLFYKVNENKK